MNAYRGALALHLQTRRFHASFSGKKQFCSVRTAEHRAVLAFEHHLPVLKGNPGPLEKQIIVQILCENGNSDCPFFLSKLPSRDRLFVQGQRPKHGQVVIRLFAGEHQMPGRKTPGLARAIFQEGQRFHPLGSELLVGKQYLQIRSKTSAEEVAALFVSHMFIRYHLEVPV